MRKDVRERMTKRALYITTRLFWPADSGRKVSLYHYCQGMSEQLGYEVHLYSFLESGQTPEMASVRPNFISSVTVASEVGLCEKAVNLVSALFDRSMPLQCCLFRSGANCKAIGTLVANINPDVAILDMVRLAPYMDVLRDAGVPVVVNFDDLLSKRYMRQLGMAGGNVLGCYSSNASGFLGKLVNGPLKNAVLSAEARRVARAEDIFGARADACLFVSPLEASELNARVGGDKCFSATLGAEVKALPPQDSKKPYDFAFVGNMNYSANQDSLRYLVGRVLPYLPGTSLRVIGVCPESVELEYANNENVSFTGWVDSIADNLGQCAVLLAPFTYGSGIKTKVLEAMGMGIPVVTNSIGLEGITAVHGHEVLCADTPEGFAKEARCLLENEELRSRVAEAGREYVKRNHAWQKSIESLGECLDFASSSSNPSAN